MKHSMIGAVSGGAFLLASAATVQAEGHSPFSWEAEIEIGVENTFKSDNPTAEVTNAFLTTEVAVEYKVTDIVSLFAGLTLESVTDPTDDRAFEDMGLYVDEIGIALNFDRATLAFGKITPAFGLAWDAAPGYFGAGFAEDYELSEALGVTGSFELGGGTLSAALFFMDNSSFSRSLGTDRGRNTTAAGGVGNTGKLNNLALQYDFEAGNTAYTLSGSLLSAGVGDVKDQTGVAFGAVHALNDNIELIGEVALFNGFGGADVDANYVTVGGAFSQGPWTYAASYTRRDVSNAPVDRLMTLGLDYTFSNDITLSSGLAFAKEGGLDSQTLGPSVIIPLGG